MKRLARLLLLAPAALLAMAVDCYGRRPGYTPPPCAVSDDAGVPLDVEDNRAAQALMVIPDTLVLVVPTAEGTRMCRPGLDDHCGALLEEACVVDLGTVPIGGERVVEVLTGDGPVGRASVEGAFVEGCPEVSATVDTGPDGFPLVRLVYTPTERGACRGELTIRSEWSANLADGEVTLPLHGDAIRHQGPPRP